MRWSNDVYMSTPHRVLPPAGAASRYAPITGADYLQERLDATHGLQGNKH